MPPSMVNQLGLPHRWTAMAHGSQWSPAVPYGSVGRREQVGDGAAGCSWRHDIPQIEQVFFRAGLSRHVVTKEELVGAREALHVLLGCAASFKNPARQQSDIDARRGVRLNR